MKQSLLRTVILTLILLTLVNGKFSEIAQFGMRVSPVSSPNVLVIDRTRTGLCVPAMAVFDDTLSHQTPALLWKLPQGLSVTWPLHPISEPKIELVRPIATCRNFAIACRYEDCDDRDSSTNVLATVPLLRRLQFH